MRAYKTVFVIILGAAQAFGCSSSSSGSSNGSSSGGSSSGSSGSSSAAGDGGGGSTGSGSAPSATCQSGQTNVADKWYAIAECKDYFDTATRCTCASASDKASCESQFTTTLGSSLCYPQGVTFSEDSAKSACGQALSAYKQSNPSCS